MFEVLVTAGSQQSPVIIEVVLATLREHPSLEHVFVLDAPQTARASREAAEGLLRLGNTLRLTFYSLSSSSERPEAIRETITQFFHSIFSHYDKQQVVIDLTAGSKAVSQLLYIVASNCGIENFQILGRRYLGKELRSFEGLVKGQDYELQALPAIRASGQAPVDVVSLPLETRTRLDSELILRCSKLLTDRHYDEAAVNAFKVLDQRIRIAIGETPEAYGEELINRAFSPDKGKLSKGLTASEKIGLRNLISGANAFFRNPSAHRFVDYDQVTVETIIVLVSFFLKMIEVAQDNKITY
ncbi:MAG: TIGR02391 family protein [Candidatus Kuenenia stuttgartiensis]|nr:TIGR02391 family protein [Candidatus Kuenenia stuttgartiensis]